MDGARDVCDWACTHMDGTVGGIKGTRTRLPRAKVGVGKSGGACASRVINPTPRQFANSGHKMADNIRGLCKHLDGKGVGISTNGTASRSTMLCIGQ